MRLPRINTTGGMLAFAFGVVLWLLDQWGRLETAKSLMSPPFLKSLIGLLSQPWVAVVVMLGGIGIILWDRRKPRPATLEDLFPATITIPDREPDIDVRATIRAALEAKRAKWRDEQPIATTLEEMCAAYRRGDTSVEANALVARFIGRRKDVEIVVLDLRETLSNTITVVAAGNQEYYNLDFPAPQSDRAQCLQKGSKVRAAGRIARIYANYVTLEDCFFLDDGP